MSFQAIRWAMEQCPSEPSAISVLIALADYTGHDGIGSAYLERLARTTGRPVDDIRVVLAGLIDDGLLEQLEIRNGANGTLECAYALSQDFIIRARDESSPAPKKKSALETLHERMGGLCFYCGIETVVWPDSSGRPLAEREHMTPVSRGGRNSRSNITLACAPCNGRKGALTVEEFRIVCGFASGSMPHTFAGEAAPPVARDVLCVSSKEFIPGLIKHNRKYRRPAA